MPLQSDTLEARDEIGIVRRDRLTADRHVHTVPMASLDDRKPFNWIRV
jgi:hypothetical protein